MHQADAIGERIRILRGKLTQDEFSQVIGINRDSVRSYEKGRAQPNAEILAKICVAYGANPAWLLLGHGEMQRAEGPAQEPRNQAIEPSSMPSGALDALWKENSELRQENRELRQENRQLLKENGDLRVALARLEARGAPREGAIDGQADEAARKSA